ncbi:hypothetical protein KTJ04_16960, partial [Acinetobacter radioresistens]|nr:hypothetical protein [Acinetobacter radioresistens]
MHHLQDSNTIIQELQQQGYVRIQVTEWTEQTRDSLKQRLLQAGIQDYQIHKIKNEPHDYLIVRKGTDTPLPYQLEKAYPSRTSFVMVLPLIVAMGLIAVTVLLSS